MSYSVRGAARSVLGAAVATVLAGLGAPAIAEEAGQARSGVIEEIIVTGTKREQSAQDVPISISAISGEQLAKQFRNDILAIGEMTPGVTLGMQPGFRAVAGGIRGTGQNSILVTQDSSVVLLVDDYSLTDVQAQFVEMFDVDRVEVYRGPQGTLFGKSATGGAISIITKRPIMNEMGADFRYLAGVFDGDDGPGNSHINKTNVAINVPLVDDTLALRVVGIWEKDEGFYENGKDTATFPENVPFYDIIGIGGTNPPFPSELSTRTRGSGQNLNDTDVFAGKIKLLFTPTENYEAYLLYDYLDDSSGTVPGVNESEPNMLLPLLGFPSVQQSGHGDILNTGVTDQCLEGNSDGLCVKDGMHIDVRGIQLQQTLTLGDYSIKLLTGTRKQEEVLANTYTGEAFTSLFDASRNTTKESTQVELRLSSQFEGPFNFVVGGNYAKEEVDMLAYATVGLTGLISFKPVYDQGSGTWSTPITRTEADGREVLNLDINPSPGTGGASQDRDTYALFADGSFEFADRWTASAGVRFTKDEKDFFRRANSGGPCTAMTPPEYMVPLPLDGITPPPGCLDRGSANINRVGGGFSAKDLQPFDIPLPDSAFGIADKFDDSWDEITYRAVIDYDVSDAGMIYLSYATGFIPGGFTETCSSLETCQPFDSETNWNLELGFKGQFLDNTVQLNGSLFYTEYEDLIRSQVVPFTDPFGVTTQETINVNAGTSQVKGLELETIWIPQQVAGLTLGLNLGWMDHEYDEFMLDVAGVPTDFSDRDVPFSPELRGSASVTYEQGTSYGTFIYNFSANYQDEAEMSVFNSPLTQMEERTLIDANVTWHEPEERYYVSLWGKNLTDERHRIGANSVAGLWNFTMYGRPLSYGLEAGVTF